MGHVTRVYFTDQSLKVTFGLQKLKSRFQAQKVFLSKINVINEFYALKLTYKPLIKKIDAFLIFPEILVPTVRFFPRHD